MRWLEMLAGLSTDTYNGIALPYAWGHERKWVWDQISDGSSSIPKEGWCFRGFPGVTVGKRGQDFGAWYQLYWDELGYAGHFTLNPIRDILKAHKAYYDKYNTTGTTVDMQGKHYIPAHIAIYVHADVVSRVPTAVGATIVSATYTTKPLGADAPTGPKMDVVATQRAYADLIKEIGTTFCDPAGSGTDHDLGYFLAGIWPGIGVAGEANVSGTVAGYTGLNISAYKTLEWMNTGFDATNRRPTDPTGYASGSWYDYGDGAHPELGSWLSPLMVCERWVRRPHQGVYIMGTGDEACYVATQYSHWCEHHDGQGIPCDGDGHDVRNYYTSQLTATDKSRHRRVYERLHSLAPELPNGHYSDQYRKTDRKFGRFDISVCKDAFWGFTDTRDMTLGMLNPFYSNATITADEDLMRRRQIVVRDWSYNTGTRELTWTHAHFLDWGVAAGSVVFFPGDTAAYEVATGGVSNTVLTLTSGPASTSAGDIYLLMKGTAREIGSCIGNEHAWAANLRDSYGVFLRMAQMKLENIDTETHIMEVLWALQWRNPNPSNPRWPTSLTTDGWFLGHREFTLLGHSMWDFVNFYTNEWPTNAASHSIYGAWRIFTKSLYNRWRSGDSTGTVRATRGLVSGTTTPTTVQIVSTYYNVTDTSRLPDDITCNASPTNSQYYSGTENPTHEDMKILTTSTSSVTRVARKVNDIGGLIEQGGASTEMTDTTVAKLLYQIGAADPDVPGPTDKKTLYGWYGLSYLGQGTLELQPFHNTTYIPDGTPVVVCLVLANVASDLEISYNAPIDATAQIYNSGYPNSQVPTSKILVKRQDKYKWRRVWLYSTYLSTATIKITSVGAWRGETWFNSATARNYLHAVVLEEPWGWYQYYLTNKGAVTPDPVLPTEVDGADVVAPAWHAIPATYPYVSSSVSADTWGNRLFYNATSLKISSAEGVVVYSETLSSGAFQGKSTVATDNTFYIAQAPTVADLVTLTKFRCSRRVTNDPLSIVVTKDIIEMDYDDTDTHTMIDMAEYDGYLYTLSTDSVGNAVHSWKTDGSETATSLISGAAMTDVIAIDVTSDGIFLLTSEAVSRLLKYTLAGVYVSTTSLDYEDYSQGLFGQPYWSAVSPTGYLFISDRLNSRVLVYDEDGVYSHQFGSHGSGDGEFESAAGIAASADYVYVAESSGSRRVQIFRHDGTFVSSFGSLGVGDGEFTTPTGMVYSTLYDRLAVADAARQDVQVFDEDGTFLCKTPAGLNFPMGVGNYMFYFYVADLLQHKIRQYNWDDASYVSEFGSYGTGDGEFNGPVGVAATWEHLYVADTGNHRVQMFTLAGVYEDEYGSQGEKVNFLNAPYGLATFPGSNNLYVCDSGNYRIVARSTADLTFVRWLGRPGGWSTYPHIAADLDHLGQILFIIFPHSFRVDRYDPNLNVLGSFNIWHHATNANPRKVYSITGVSDGTHASHLILGMDGNAIFSTSPLGVMIHPAYFGPLVSQGGTPPAPYYNQSDKYAPDGGDTFMLTINGIKYSRYAVNWEVPEGDGLTW